MVIITTYKIMKYSPTDTFNYVKLLRYRGNDPNGNNKRYMTLNSIAKFLNVSITKVHRIVQQIRKGKEAPIPVEPKPLKRMTFHSTIMKQISMGKIESEKKPSVSPKVSSSHI